MRLIDKLPSVPKFDKKIIRMVSDLLFIEDKPFNKADSSDTITYVPIWKYDWDNGWRIGGSMPHNHNAALQIMGNIAFLKDMFCGNQGLNINRKHLHFIPQLIITGGISPAYTQDNEETRLVKQLYTKNGAYDWNDVLNYPQSEIIKDLLMTMKWTPWSYQNGAVKPLLDTKSTNTKENFMAVKEAGWYKDIKHLRLFTTAESSLRVLATARKQLPELTDVATMSYTPTFPEYNVVCDKENWAKHQLSQRYVYGELLRVIKYDELGDIKLTDIEKTKLNNIVAELSSKQRC